MLKVAGSGTPLIDKSENPIWKVRSRDFTFRHDMKSSVGLLRLDRPPPRSKTMPPARPMKSKPQTKLQVLTGKVSRLNQEVVAHERKYLRLCDPSDQSSCPTGRQQAQQRPKLYKPATSHLIPKPQGRSGRGDGYNLRNALGLRDNKAKYNKLRVRSRFNRFSLVDHA